MAAENGPQDSRRVHVVLVPGFGGFDALGNVEYYAGITRLFQGWRTQNPFPVVLHYFDNFPTAAVATRATRLRQYLAKRVARGEILATDRIVLVGHSTAGLDIRRLIWDLHDSDNDPVHVDGGVTVPARRIRDCLDAVVFLSVPHWGTNIADWVHSHPVLRTAVIAELGAAVAGSQVYLLDRIESWISGGAAYLTDAELLLAVQDALTEANERFGKPGPLRTAGAQEAASDLGLYLRHMASDFHVINDLTSHPGGDRTESPAHFGEKERKQELKLWEDPPIRALSYATVGGRPFRFPKGRPAPVWNLSNVCTYPEIAKDLESSAGTDFLYRLCYRACAGGPLRWPPLAGKVKRTLGPAPETPIELWDNDGIVNTASMLWNRGDVVLVAADHLDVIGHCKLVPDEGGDGRRYRSYDSFKSVPQFSERTLEKLWTEIFDWSVSRTRGGRTKRAGAGAG